MPRLALIFFATLLLALPARATGIWTQCATPTTVASGAIDASQVGVGSIGIQLCYQYNITAPGNENSTTIIVNTPYVEACFDPDYATDGADVATSNLRGCPRSAAGVTAAYCPLIRPSDFTGASGDSCVILVGDGMVYWVDTGTAPASGDVASWTFRGLSGVK